MKAQPEPMVSGKYFLPNAPLLCLKRIPACPVTSVNSITPEGRGGVGLAEGDGDAVVATSDCCAAGFWADCLLHEVTSKSAAVSRKIEMILVSVSLDVLKISAPPLRALRLCGFP